MNLTQSSKKMTVLTIMLFLFTNLSIHYSIADQQTLQLNDIDQNDGIYYTETFPTPDTTFSHCKKPQNENKVILDPDGSTSNNYNFSSWTIASNNRMYYYDSLIFFPVMALENYIKKYETEVTNPTEYGLVGSLDDTYFPLEGFSESSPLKRMHHFRFKITQDINTTTYMKVSWYGKVENSQDLSIYVWRELIGGYGYWEKAASRSDNQTTFSLMFTFSNKLPIQSTGYVDVCVVLTPKFGNKCTLFTDFINIMVQGEGYATDGFVRSPTIDPNNISQWGYASWEDYTPPQTDILYHICYEDANGTNHLIDNKNLTGNIQGFTKGPINLNSIPITYNISIQANFSTSDLSISPELYGWGFSWQTTPNIWKDTFTSNLRVNKDDIQNVLIEDGTVSVLPSINNWPMFGQNPSNTRETPGLGPDQSDQQLAWYTIDKVGGTQRNPIFHGGMLYIASNEGDKIIAYNALQQLGSTKPNIKLRDTPTLNYEIKTSPAITSKNTIVAATASSSSKGDVENVVYGFDTKTLNIAWTFNYKTTDSENPAICYESSPIIKNNNIYLSTWSGDTSIWNSLWSMFNFSRGNNKLICLTDTGSKVWTFDLPAGSFSSPAVTDTTIIVGCENLKGSSIFAVDTNGKKIWEKDIGPIGYASPVVYDNIVYMISKTPTQTPFTAYTKIVALRITDATILWNHTVGDMIPDKYSYAGYNTPAVADDRVFVASPDGYLYAFDHLTGDQRWETQVYKKGLLSNNHLVSSPAYADGMVFIGTPDGDLKAIRASDGSILFTMQSISRSPVISSPIIVDGLAFMISENGMLQAIGKPRLPDGTQITGSIISQPITLPTDNDSYIWNRFFAGTETENGHIKFSILDASNNVLIGEVEDGALLPPSTMKNHKTIRLKALFHSNTNGKAILHEWSVSYRINGEITETTFFENTFNAPGNPPTNCSIQIQNTEHGIWNTSARFKLQYENTSGQQISDWLYADCTGTNGSKLKETIHVNLSNQTSIKNLIRYEYIKFSIKDIEGYESFSKWFSFPGVIYPDTAPPIFYESSFQPSSLYIISPKPTCTILAKDIGIENNITGIDVSSANFTIQYTDQSGTKTDTFKAQCSGTNGTKVNVTITANIASLSFSDTITDIHRIRFSIKDMAGNQNTSIWFNLSLDNIKPTSNITNSNEIPTFCNTSPVVIKASASDTGSGVKDVSLYYRMTTATQWSLFGKESTEPYQWSFTIGSDKGGEYELCTIATDKAGNEQSFPSTGEVLFVFDPNPPSKPTFVTLYEFTTDEIPVFDDVIFKDDYRLKQVLYRMNFEGINEWTPLNTEDLNVQTYTPTWNLTLSQWNTMIEDEQYYIYFKVIDVLGNIYETPSSSQALTLVKNLQNTTIYDPDLSDFDGWSWNNEYTIQVTINESQVSLLQLWYSYSPNETVGQTFSQYGKNLTNGSSTWKFIPDQGTGYYSFYVVAYDTQGQQHISTVKTVHLTIFPLLELLVFIILLFVLFVFSALIFKKYRKRSSL
ncbi:MAG: PQQ-like beta-propeller repeat protein [Candidatus Thermoplasmatota archaeon]|nr:PQQ-like beta-propeller repeat protein [Candidatus Thermoplasmatota archaeon]